MIPNGLKWNWVTGWKRRSSGGSRWPAILSGSADDAGISRLGIRAQE
jgi:hypothetical protein